MPIITRSKRKLEDSKIPENKKQKINTESHIPTNLEEKEEDNNHSSPDSESEHNSPNPAPEDSDSDDDYLDEVTMLNNLKTIDNEAYDSLVQVKNEIARKVPNFINILKAPMRVKDKARILEMYEVYSTAQMLPPTEEVIDLKSKINRMIKQYCENYKEYSKFPIEEIQKMKQMASNLKTNSSNFSLKNSILSLNTDDKTKACVYKRFQEMKNSSIFDDNHGKCKTWINTALKLPHDNIKEFPYKENLANFLQKVSDGLDKELYGMKNVKEQILVLLNSKLCQPDMKGCSIALIGEPGTGKTSIARCLSDLLELPFEQISFGGVRDPGFLKGHDYTYIGSRPGEISRCMTRMKYKNGILFLDEFEKISDNKDITSLLLHITDPSQNFDFKDNYLGDISIDLSRLWFIYSMNSLPEDTALCDRLHVIEVSGYNEDDKIKIIINYLFPKYLKNIGKLPEDIVISQDIAKYIVTTVSLPSEKGVRTIEKAIKDIINKVNFLVQNQADDGELNMDNISFNINKKLTYPVILTCKMIDTFLKNSKKKNEDHLNMYI